MSLTCLECGYDVQPGDVFPGREGGMVHALVPNGSNLTGASISNGVACCFFCLFTACKGDAQTNSLRRVFATYNAETSLNKFAASNKAFSRAGAEERKKLKGLFEKMLGAIPTDTCLCCDDTLDQAQPVFVFHVMDRMAGEGDKSFFGSYQWTRIKTGRTSFKICVTCVQKFLPRTYFILIDPSKGELPPPAADVSNELILSVSFSDEVKRQILDNLPPGTTVRFDELSPEQEEHIRKHLPPGTKLR